MSDDRPVGGVLLGIAWLVRFRARGLALFGNTPQAFMNSLAPLLAFPLVGGLLRLIEGAPREALADVLASVVALLAPAVLSHAIASLWRREALWLRYAVAYNWCQSAMTLATLLVGAFTAVAAASLGWDAAQALVKAALAFVLIYWLVLGWFLAWRGLQLSAGRAVLFVLLLNIGVAALMIGPLVAMLATR